MDLRVVHLTRDFPPPCRGGISTAVHGLVASAPESGPAQAVVSLERERRQVALEAGRVPVLRAGPAADVQALVDWALAQQPNLIHLHDSFLWPVAEALGVRKQMALVFSVHVDQRTMAARRGLTAPSRSQLAQDAAVRAAQVVLVPSPTAAATLAAADPEIAGKIQTVPHGIADSPAARQAVAARWAGRGGPVVYVGRYDELKGTADFCAALPRLLGERPQQRVVIAGGLPAAPRSERRWHRRWQQQWPTALATRIELRGWLEPAALADLYAQASVVVVPSRYETFGLVAAEAMSFGAAVVAARGGALHDRIEEGETGLTFAAGDPAELARQVGRLLDDPALAFRLGQHAAAQLRGSYTWERAWRGLLPAYGGALGHFEQGIG